jgi:hypothetical protein
MLVIMEDLAPDITRQRLLVEGFFTIDVDEEVIRAYFERITSELQLRTYGPSSRRRATVEPRTRAMTRSFPSSTPGSRCTSGPDRGSCR